MLKDINRILRLIKSNDGKQLRQKFLIIFCGIILLFSINRYILVENANDDYKIAFTQSKLLFKNGINPYEIESQNYINRIADEEGWKITKEFGNLGNPIFQYYFIFPFTLIENYKWSQTVFITISQIFVILSAQMLLRLLKWNPNMMERTFLLFLTSSLFFITSSLTSANISALQLLLFVAALYFSEKENHILSGILLGFSFFDPIGVFYLFILFFIVLIKQKKYLEFVWAFITLSLLTISSFIFSKNWIFGWLKYLFLTSSRYPFISYIKAAEMKFNFQVNRLFSVIPIILGLWFLIELFRTPKDKVENNLWLLSIGGILNHYLMVQSDVGTEVFFLPGLMLLIGLWWQKINLTAKVFLNLFLGISSFGVIIWQLFFMDIYKIDNEVMLVIGAIFLVANLYWVRPWVMNRYDVANENQKFL